MLSFINLLFLVSIGFSNAISQVSQEANSRISQCGGTIDADSDSLSYPDVGQPLQKGEVCVWTIHLETTKNFKFNFTSLNVNSNYEDCRDGGVRIYSLTNLVPADKLESYTFCDERPSADSFYLGENVAVVVLYVGSSNTNPGSGFTLSWEGSAFDPLKTKHVSSFSTASNGIIRYPVIGHYETNIAATWLIKSISMLEDTKSDFSLESLSLESCGNPDKCTCDALILYEISPLGFVNETRRFCGETSGAVLSGIESRFIVAFFTDFNAQSGGGEGFEVDYYQTQTLQCGGTIDADSDSLSYPDVGQSLQKGEVCVWTVHLETMKNFKFNFTSLNVNSNYEDCRDGGVRIYSLTNLVPADKLESYTFCDKKESEDSFYLGENVVTVVLYVGLSNANPGSGFTLSWEGSAFDPLKTKHLSSFSSASNGNIRYPVIGNYETNLAATWLIKSISMEEDTKSDFTLESLNLESCGNPDRCTCDALILYEISPLGFVNESRRFCGETSGAFVHGLESRFIVAFFTDFNTQSGGGEGFEVSYYQTEESTTYGYETTTPQDEATIIDWYDTTT